MPANDLPEPLHGTAYAVLAAQDAMMLWGRNEATETALNEALATYYAAEALDPDSLQAVLARMLGEAMEAADAAVLEPFTAPTGLLGPLGIRNQHRADVLDAYDIPESLREAWRQIDEERR